MDEGDDFNYSDLDDVAFDEEASAFPEQGFEEPQTGAVVVAAPSAYGSGYESEDLATRSPSERDALRLRQQVGASTSRRRGGLERGPEEVAFDSRG